MKNWEDVKIAPEFNEQGVACYRLTGADFLNEYYIISEAETRKLLNTPEIVGYESNRRSISSEVNTVGSLCSRIMRGTVISSQRICRTFR